MTKNKLKHYAKPLLLPVRWGLAASLTTCLLATLVTSLVIVLAGCASATPQATTLQTGSTQAENIEHELPQIALSHDKIIAERQLKLPFSYIKWAKVSEEQLLGYPAKTLSLQFKQPQTVLSSLHGWKENILTVGNHSSGPASWPLTHKLGMEAVATKLTTLLELNPQTSTFLFTGANMDNLVYVEKTALPAFKSSLNPLKIGVLVTAGVQTNALRAGRDSGDYWEPGTINIIILSNRKLGDGAMSNMLITATEAKTAALEDLDIRSSSSGLPATGTGTDNIIVVSGQGLPAKMSGGHTKLGELLTKAVYEATIQAIAKQNQLVPGRSINLRLTERGIKLKQLLNQSTFAPSLPAPTLPGQNSIGPNSIGLNSIGANSIGHTSTGPTSDSPTSAGPTSAGPNLPAIKAGQKLAPLSPQQKAVLLENFYKTMQNPRYAGFMACALSLADSEERGLLTDTSLFSEQCLLVASELAGQPLKKIEPIVYSAQTAGQTGSQTGPQHAPEHALEHGEQSNGQSSLLLQEALNAILTGIYYKNFAL